MLAHILAEEREGGEVQFVGYLLDALILFEQKGADVLYGLLVDERQGCLSGQLLAHGGEILGRYAETLGIVGHGAGAGIFAGEAAHKFTEEGIGRAVRARGERTAALQDVAELVEEELQQAVDNLLGVLRVGGLKLGYEQVAVHTEQIDLLRL